MKNMKTRYFIILMAVALFALSCNKDVAIGEPTVLPLDVEIPQGLAPAATDQKIVDFFHKYNTYLIYEYEQLDVIWRLVGNSSPTLLNTYQMPKSNPEKVSGQIDLLQRLLIDFYPDEFLKRQLPYKIFLADRMLFQMGGWNEWGSWVSGTNMIFGLGRVDYQMQADSMYWAFNFANRDFQTFLFNNQRVGAPEEFFAHTDYVTGLTATTTQYLFPSESRFRSIAAPHNDHLARGVFANLNAAQAISAKQTADLQNYLSYMRWFPKNSPQWDRFLSFPLVKAKYDILVDHWIRTYGYNPHSLGEADFGPIVL